MSWFECSTQINTWYTNNSTHIIGQWKHLHWQTLKKAFSDEELNFLSKTSFIFILNHSPSCPPKSRSSIIYASLVDFDVWQTLNWLPTHKLKQFTFSSDIDFLIAALKLPPNKWFSVTAWSVTTPYIMINKYLQCPQTFSIYCKILSGPKINDSSADIYITNLCPSALLAITGPDTFMLNI